MAHVFGWPEILPRDVYNSLTSLEPVNAWFEVYEIAEGVYALYEPFHFEEVISFVICGDERAILLDTGMGVADIRAEAENLTPLPLAVVNTHWHYDHIGGNHQFEDIWVFDNDFEVGKIERGMTTEEISYKMRPELVCSSFPEGFDPTTYHIRGCTVTRRLQHMEELELGNRVLTVHHTPGHSPGHISLYDTRDHILFCADVYYPGTLYCNLERSSLDDYIASLEYLVNMLDGVSLVATPHNEAVVPAHELEDALGGFRQIANGTADYVVRDGTRLYRFPRFLVKYPDE